MFKKNITPLVLIVFMLNSFCISIMGQKTIQHAFARDHINLNGSWKYIIDPYQMGYLDYRQKPFDQSRSGKGGFYDNITSPEKKQGSNTILILSLLYKFLVTGTLKIRDFCSMKVLFGTKEILLQIRKPTRITFYISQR